MSRTRKLAVAAAGLVAIIVIAAAFIVDSWTDPTPVPLAPITTTSVTNSTNPTTTATNPFLPPIVPTKKHGHGNGSEEDDGD